MKGVLFYNQEEYQHNQWYAQALCQGAERLGSRLEVHFPQEVLGEGVFSCDGVSYAINRTRSYELSLLLELNGVRVFNNSTVTLLGNHKIAAYRHAQQRKVPFLPLYTNWHHKESILSKPVSGHGGEGIAVGEQAGFCLPDTLPRLQQAFAPDIVGDVRFYVLGGKLLTAVLRKKPAGSILANYTKGAVPERFPYEKSHEQLVYRLLEGLNADYVGVDFLVKQDGSLLFGEMEDVVGSRMLSALGENETPRLFMEHVMNRLQTE